MQKDLPEKTTFTEVGSIKIADEVVAIIAGLAATEVKGVAGMSGGIVGGIAELVGKKNPSKGVKVEVGEKEAAVDLFVIVEFGVRIPEVAHEIQRNVKKSIESMTGLSVVEINVHVQGVAFPHELRDEEHPRVK
ncbi:Asp23/Gls24 family envelope stress response protein [Thermanaerosceptrum fracticalcis]|uniref:Asp23/Gls24 family envelope stress response protein n=1 Tax=Thermanaerosceptrum fracticalcis TaxID=1712410 RepID=A0A7G6E0C8_THEFR|nr:Asp23/Gls24 family envelope stress response protein [Thermanaerosceptrum fracticalcis]QNB45532.1 Asp23/Gls24 family envelope stress response protein [Thermanaerosceptrum fracticalcis]